MSKHQVGTRIVDVNPERFDEVIEILERLQGSVISEDELEDVFDAIREIQDDSILDSSLSNHQSRAIQQSTRAVKAVLTTYHVKEVELPSNVVSRVAEALRDDSPDTIDRIREMVHERPVQDFMHERLQENAELYDRLSESESSMFSGSL